MNDVNKTYVEICGKQNKRFYLRGERLFESLTLDEYNQRYETTYTSWDEFADDDIELFTAEELLNFFKDKDVSFV